MSPAVLRSLVAAIACGALSAVGFGLAVPALALNLDDWGLTRSSIGLFTTAAGISTILFTPIVPILLRWFGVHTVMRGAVFLGAVLLVAFPVFEHPVAWLVIRFAFAAVLTALFVSSEAWLIELAPPHRRSLVIGVYASALAGCYGLGGLIIGAVGYAGLAPFAIGAGIFLLGLVPLALDGPGATPPAKEGAGLAAMGGAFVAAPLIFVAPFVMAAIETALFNLGPLYVRDIQLGDAVAGYVITAMALGNVVLQLPIGWLADRIGAYTVLLIAAVAAVAGPLLVLAAGAQVWALYAALFVYSGLVTALYATALALMGRRFPADRLASANAGFAMAYGMGQLVSPASAGPAMDAVGPQGLLWTLAVIAAAFLVFALWRRRDAAAPAQP